ncbi:hypothetical protein DK313_15270, partial [Mycobacterium tuberculosis]
HDPILSKNWSLRTCRGGSVGPPQFKVDELGRGAYVYVGKDATVVLNKDGQVVTAWANSRAGWRNP